MVAYQEALMNEYAKREMAKSGVAWFKFDEASGNVNDSKGTAVGTVTGTTRVQGISGNAISFNGTGDFIDFNNPIIPLGKKSIRFKMKKANMQSKVENIIGNSNATSEHGTNVFFGADNFLYFQSTKAVSGTPRFLIGFNYSSYADNQWHDILLTWDGSVNTNGVKMYIDDMTSPKTQGTANLIESTQAGRSLRVARGFNTTVGAEGFFNGQLDNLEIYNDVIDLTPINKTLILHDGEYKRATDKEVKITYVTEDIMEDVAENINMMSSNTPSPYVVSTSAPIYTGREGWRTFVQGNTVAWQGDPTALPQWVMIDLGTSIKLSKIEMQHTGSTGFSGMPSSMRVEGSNNGNSFSTIKTYNSIPAWSSGEKREFAMDSAINYRYIRFNTLANHGNSSQSTFGRITLFTKQKTGEKVVEIREVIDIPIKIEVVSSTLPTSTQFLEQGMDSLSPLLDRKVTTLEPMTMIDKSEILGVGEIGKVFGETIDLKKYFDIRSVRTEVK